MLPTPLPKAPSSCKFWGLGGDGTVGANKNSIKIIGDHTDKYIQAYFQYDSKKTGGVTISPPALRRQAHHARRTTSTRPTSLHATTRPTFIKGYKMVNDVKPGGVFMTQLPVDAGRSWITTCLPSAVKRYIAKNNIQLYTINAIDKATEIGMGKRTNTILQSAFFALAKRACRRTEAARST